MVEWPDGPRLFEYLRGLPAPLRVAGLTGYLGSLGLSPNGRILPGIRVSKEYRQGGNQPTDIRVIHRRYKPPAPRTP